MAGGRGLKMACQHGTYSMREPEMKRLGEGSWALTIPCDFGAHYLTPDPEHAGAFVFGVEPYGFPSHEDAWAAADVYAADLARRYR